MVARARIALNSIARADERVWIPFFIETITGGWDLAVGTGPGSGVLWEISEPGTTQITPNLGNAAFELQKTLTPTGRPRKEDKMPVRPADSANVSGAMQAVEDWVRAPYTGRDDPKSGKEKLLMLVDGEARDAVPMDELVERIQILVGLKPAKGGKRSEAMQEAGDKLMAYIQRFAFAQQGEHPGLTQERSREWLRAVGRAWLDLWEMYLPRMVRTELRELWKRSGEGLGI